MRRPLVIALAVLALVLVSLPVAAHGNELAADPQVSGNGTVVLEKVGSLVDGYVVVHEVDSDGNPGEPIGHAHIASNQFVKTVTVSIDDQVWADWGDNRTVVVALHRNEGADAFDPDEDPIQQVRGSPVATQFALGKGPAETSVVADEFETQTTTNASVTIHRVAVADATTLAVRTNTDTPRVVGQRQLDPGVHHNVTVQVTADLFTSDSRRVDLLATLYPGDANLSTSATPLRVGGEPIQTGFSVERVGSIATQTTSARTPTPTQADEDHHDESDHDHESPHTETTTATPTTTTPQSSSPQPSASPTQTNGGTSTSGPGFGPVIAGFAVVLGVVGHALGWRRQRP